MSDQHFKIRDKRGTNRYFVDNKFLKEYGAKLGPYSIAVYNVLVMRADFDTQAYKTSYQTIADLTGMSRRQAMREVEKLVSHNIIAKEVKWHPSETGKKVYTDPEFTLLHPDQWGNTDSIMDTRTSDTQSLPIDNQSPEVMTPSHQTSDTQSPPPSDSESLINKQEPITQEPLQKDSADNPPKPRTKKQKLFVAIVSLCHIDFETASDPQLNQVKNATNALIKRIDDPQDFERDFKTYWYSCDWRGKKDQCPIPSQVRDVFGDFQHWLKNGQQKGQRNNGQKQPGRNQETNPDGPARKPPADNTDDIRREIARLEQGIKGQTTPAT